jgi:hypothetical protein
MITNTGKGIIGKYLLGQAPSYASYIAIGCGAKPLSISNDEDFGDYSEKTSLDFEMFRVPISSKGFVDDNGITKIVLTAELPTEERYEITEVGIYSAGSNPSAASIDSRTIFGFTVAENWQKISGATATSIPQVTDRLDSGQDGIITTTESIFQANADNLVFTNSQRVNKFESGRYYNNMVFLRGDTSIFGYNNDTLEIQDEPEYIQITGIRADFSRNSPTDELRLAFSIVYDSPGLGEPKLTRVLLELSDGGTESARFFAEIDSDNYDIANDRYFVDVKQLQELYKTSNFAWTSVNSAKIYACVLDVVEIEEREILSNVVTITTWNNHGLQTGDLVRIVDTNLDFSEINGIREVTVPEGDTDTFTFSLTADDQELTGTTELSMEAYIEKVNPEYYVALDAMRLENVSTQNPLYGLVGYSVVKNTDGATLLKTPNSNNYIEFRFVLEVT